MKKTHKKVVGLLSLGAVAGMTVFAATLPSPSASATSTFTDTMVVRVLGNAPDVTLLQPGGNISVVGPNQKLEFNYENVKSIKIALRHTSSVNGAVTVVDDFADIDANNVPGTFSEMLNLNDYGYGTFEFTITAENENGVMDVEAVVITYSQLESSMAIDNEDPSKVTIKLDYEGIGTPDHSDVKVTNADGDEVFAGAIVPPDDKLEILFDEIDGLVAGDYTITVTSYDEYGNIIYTKDYTYKYELAAVPNTGSFFKDFNVSKEDFLITGLIMFFAISMVGIGIIAKRKH